MAARVLLNMGAGLARVLLLASLAVAALCASAQATTVGGINEVEHAPMALAGGRLLVPEILLYREMQDFALRITVRLQRLGPGGHGWSTTSLYRGALGGCCPTTPGPSAVQSPSVAGAGGAAALAWNASAAVSSAALDPGTGILGTAFTHPTSGTLDGSEPVALALGSAGARAVAYGDGGGLHLQSVSAYGVGSAPALVAVDRTDRLSLNRDGGGGWWVLWRSSGWLRAAHVSVAGVAGPPHPIAPTGWTQGHGAAGSRPWRAAGDGAGGLWIALPARLMHLSADGGSTTVALGPVALSEGDGGAAVASPAPGGSGVAVRRAGSQLGPPIVLRDAGRLGTIAVDPLTRAIEIVTTRRGRVRITAIGPAGRPGGALDLPTCRGLHPAQVLADAGLIAVSCAGDSLEDPGREQTGGEFVASIRRSYVLLRAGRVLVAGTRISSIDAF